MYRVTAYLTAGLAHEFPAKSLNHAREVAGRIVREGLWVVEADGTELYYPAGLVFKVKVEKAG